MAVISDDGRWLALHVHLMPTRTDVILLDRETGARTVMVEGEEASTWVQIVGGRIYAVTNLGAPRGRVIAADLDRPQADAWETIVPESEGSTGAVIEGMVIAGDSLIVSSTEHAVSRLRRYRLDGSPLGEIELPELGSLAGLDADPRADGERVFLTFTSFARPPGLWRWTPGGRPRTVGPARLAPRPRRLRGRAGLLPVHRRRRGPDVPGAGGGHAPSGRTRPPCSRATAASPSPPRPASPPGLVAFCEAGGVYAIAGLRGGGEYGEDWHRAGMLATKQQVFDDFHAAADWLVAQGHTSRDRLAIRGGSNGGLLVGAAITQRPDLCRAVVCAVPLLDMVRYQRFLIGALWMPEYGDPAEADEFAVLHAYSPYHHVAAGYRLPGHDHHHRRVRLPRRPAARPQVRGRPPGRDRDPRRPARPPAHRDPGRPRRGQAGLEAGRRGRRPVGVRVLAAGDGPNPYG